MTASLAGLVRWLLVGITTTTTRARGIGFFTFAKMDLQHVGQHEALSAIVTNVRTLSIVGFPVDPNVPSGGESLLADFTNVALLVVVGAPTFGHLAPSSSSSRFSGAIQGTQGRRIGI